MREQPNAATGELVGRYGRATRLNVPQSAPGASTTLVCWLMDSPKFSPAWNQWAITVVTLADVDGVAPAKLAFVGATHELTVFALSPDHPFSQERADRGDHYQRLTPVNYCDQFEATDQEMLALTAWMVWGMVNGHLQVEPNGRYDRESWLASATKTLAHIRGEAHAQ